MKGTSKNIGRKFALIHIGTDEVYGLEYVAAELKQHGHQIRWFDGDLESAVDDVIDWHPEYMCFSTLTTFFQPALEFSRKVKSQNGDIKSIFGGHHVTVVPEVYKLVGSVVSLLTSANISNVPTVAVDWSPDGNYLAISHDDNVSVKGRYYFFSCVRIE